MPQPDFYRCLALLIGSSALVLLPACGAGGSDRAADGAERTEHERPIVVVDVEEPHPSDGPTVKVAGTVDPSGAALTVAGSRVQIKDGRFRAIVTGLKPDERREVPVVASKAGYRTNHSVVRVSRNPNSEQLREYERDERASDRALDKFLQEETTERDDGASKWSTQNEPGLTVSQQDVYEEAKILCGLKSPRGVAKDFSLNTTDPDVIATRYARGYFEALKPPAYVGCFEGLTK